MKNSILCLIFIAGALLLSATDGFSKGSYGDNVNSICAPDRPYNNCTLCHTSDYGDRTDAKVAYLAGGTTLTDYFCLSSTTPSCTDNDFDGYGDPGDASCNDGAATDCDDSDSSTYPGAQEVCDDQVDNDCDGRTDCEDSTCFTDSWCLADSCGEYDSRGPCKTDPRCDWRGKGKSCYTVSAAKADCAKGGGRWSKKNEICIYR